MDQHGGLSRPAFIPAELWLHAVEQFGKRRAANRITPACSFNANAQPVPGPLVARGI